jgi:hypothetical protein
MPILVSLLMGHDETEQLREPTSARVVTGPADSAGAARGEPFDRISRRRF